MLFEPGVIEADAFTPIEDEEEEWYGLEYALELSAKERQPSDTQSSAGEHSRVISFLYPVSCIQD